MWGTVLMLHHVDQRSLDIGCCSFTIIPHGAIISAVATHGVALAIMHGMTQSTSFHTLVGCDNINLFEHSVTHLAFSGELYLKNVISYRDNTALFGP